METEDKRVQEIVMATRAESRIDEYLRDRLMPVEGTIPHLARTDIYGNSIPAGSVGGDLFEYINFQQRYNIDARIARALRLSKEYLEPVSEGQVPRNSVDQFVHWLASNPPPNGLQEDEYRRAKSSEQFMVAENLRELYTSAGVLLVDAQGMGSFRRRYTRYLSRFYPRRTRPLREDNP